ncbi:MAG: protein phosphatase 2C domain-containing protein [Chloroflexota bacterium]|nr:protein phosphatase 2C domain-containing protein [Chloroflexota bacterium]
MRCPKCATDNRPEARFCRVCGQPLAAVTAAPQTLDAGGGPEPTLEMPWPVASLAAHGLVAPAWVEDDSPARSDPSAPTPSAPAPAESDPAALTFPADFAGASALAAQENATESHSDSASDSPAAVDQGAATLPSDLQADDEDATSLRTLPSNLQADDEAATSPSAAHSPTDEPAPAPPLEGRSAAEPPPAGLVPGTSDESLASPPSTAPAAPVADPTAPTADALSADSAADLAGAAPNADAASTALTGEAADNPATPSPADLPATDEADSDLTRDLPGGDSRMTATNLPLTAETGDSTTGPLPTADSGTPTAPAADEPTAAPLDHPAADEPTAAPLDHPAADETGSATTQPAESDETSNPQAATVPPLPPFGEPETVADPPDSVAPSSLAVADAPPVEAGNLSAEAATSHLREDDAPAVAAPVPGEAFPALQPGTVVAGRYTITQVLQTGPQRQTYLATDGQGYLRCWACGSRDNIQGELYCTNCGAQLTGRSYRLFETPPGTPAGEIAPPLLENLHSGVAGVFDSLTDPANGRHYLVLEDVGGKSLALALAPPTGSADSPPTAAHLLAWIAAATQTLAELHAARIVGCDFTPQALGVLPDDRLVLVDPSACRMAGEAGDDRSAGAEQQADVQRVAATLEQWLTATAPAGSGDDNTASLTPAVTLSAGHRPPHTEETIHTILARGREGTYKTAAELAAAIHDLLVADQPPADLQLISGRATDVGVQRKLNEDSLFALETVTIETSRSTPTALYIVADGMGGHESGEIASSIAVRTIPAMLNTILDSRVHGDSGTPDQDTLDEAVREAILEANRRITELGRQRQSDMGTTVTMALVLGNSVTVANVGDSRTYLWRDGKLHQISEDHSLVARLIAAGQLTAEEGRHFERRNEIYRALGDGHLTPADVDVFHAHLRPLDALVLCSDGLWEMVRDADIEQIMLDAPDPPAATQALIAAANKAGGEDNITVIIAQTLTSSEDADA